jgi:hypothetical protein
MIRNGKDTSSAQEVHLPEDPQAIPNRVSNGSSGADSVPKHVALDGIKVDGIYEQMQIAYQLVEPPGKTWPAAIRRWRTLFVKKPDRFMAILEKQEAKFLARQAEAKTHAAEFERRGLAEVKLTADLTAANRRIAELEAKLVAAQDDEYADPAIERLEELFDRLAREK